MILLGSGFSSTFSDVILVTNAIILSVVVLAAFFDELSGICAKGFHHASAMLACLIAHLGPRHR